MHFSWGIFFYKQILIKVAVTLSFDLPMQCDNVVLSFCDICVLFFQNILGGKMKTSEIAEWTEQILGSPSPFSQWMKHAWMLLDYEPSTLEPVVSWNWIGEFSSVDMGNSSVSWESEKNQKKNYQMALKVCVKRVFFPARKREHLLLSVGSRNSWESWQLN